MGKATGFLEFEREEMGGSFPQTSHQGFPRISYSFTGS